ncbi:aminoglycoside phosphotransferase family protein [Microbacterium esteraromaticum]|uniref:aminoglycoside phosphotransferase family protein n=1 Tax=Microbacterium esteraromaticum TaxID=57043 RepID=UPI001A90A7EF|nr:aminoglycoside phosphotransferase family protein [Microbacterium esteraromaticum]MBN8424669.1 aminoglycoside phosphotransferase family protein [Microbacterium esteraromaticum]
MTAASGEITSALVQSLVSEQFPQWAQLQIRPVEAQGWDNRTFRLGDCMAVRLPSADGYIAGLVREEQTLATLGSRISVAIPRVLATGAPSAAFNRPWSVREWIDGHTLAAVDASDRERAIDSLGDALAKLQSCDTGGGPWAGRASAYRGCHVSSVGEDVQGWLPLLNGREADGCRKLWDAAVATVWTGAPVWVHGDVAPGNMLFDSKGQLAALIDFGQTCVGDPACDLAFAWLSCSAGERDQLRDRLTLPEDAWLRGAAWALWKALISSPEDVLAKYGRSRDAVLSDVADLTAG